MAKAPAFEQNLVSMVSSLIHLRTIGEELSRKPFGVPRLQAEMAASTKEFEALKAQFIRTEEALQREAMPYLTEWLQAQSLCVGGEIRIRANMHGASISGVRGCLSNIRLHHGVFADKRCVELTLSSPEFSVGLTGPYAPYESFPRESLSIMGYRVRWDEAGFKPGAIVKQLLVILPIKALDLAALAKSYQSFELV